MYTKNLKIESLINKNIKLGNSVKFIDDSLMALKTDNKYLASKYNIEDSLLIINSYKELTNSENKLKDIIGIVIEINVKDYCSVGYKSAYITDITVKLGDAEFRTSSKMVIKI